MFYELVQKAYDLESQGKRIIRMSIGDTNLPTPQKVVDAAVKSLQSQKAGYVASGGINPLKEAIAKREGCSPENVVVGPGSKLLITSIIYLFTKPGDKVVFPSPFWPAYRLMCQRFEREPVIVKGDEKRNWEFDELPLDDAGLVILCNPSNPTSAIYSEAVVNRVLKRAKEKNVPVLLDEAYKGIAFEEIPKYDATFRVRSFSKEFNMEGWRLGYAVGPEDMISRVEKFNRLTITCVPNFIQQAGVTCLSNEKEILDVNRSTWVKRRQIAERILKKAGFRFNKPKSGIYVFATHDKISDSGKFALDLLEKGVAISPGACHGDHNNYVRITLNQEEKLITEALEIMCDYLQNR